MPTIIDKSFVDNIALLDYLTGLHEVSLAQLAEDASRKTLTLSAASYFEHQIKEALRIYCIRRTSADGCIVSMVRIKVLEREYHSFFDWNTRKGGQPFFRLLGDDIGTELKKECTADPLKGSLAAFLELGYLRNCLVHQNFASYSFEKTTKEVYDLYGKAVVFVNRVMEKLAQPATAAELQQKIQERAYEIYLSRGKQGGQADDDWLQAEKEVLNGG